MTPTTLMPHAGKPGTGRNASPFMYGPEPEAVATVLHSGQYGHTDVTEKFEQDVAAFLGVGDAIAVASGTTALHLALLAAGIGQGDEVLVPSMTFCASVQAILAVGARPRFMDVDPATLCVRPDEVMDALTPETRAVIPVLYGGRAVDLTSIHHDLAARDILVIEDAAHAFGSRHTPGGKRVGADDRTMTCFSFGPVKNLTCGQGGMIIPCAEEQAQTARRLRMLGVAESATARAAATVYTVTGPGYRAQMSAINAAIGSVQLEHFTTAETTRRRLWNTYRDALADLPDTTLVNVGVDQSVPSLCVARVPDRDRVFHCLREQGIGVGVHYPPNHLQPAFSAWRRPLPATEAASTQILTLPFHQHLADADVHRVAELLKLAITS